MANKPIPELRELNGQKVLYVDGEPFLILSFQLDCDSCYSAETIDRLMKAEKQLGCNAASLLLYWRLIESEEGKYDFSILDSMLESANCYDLRIVLVWFGSYKNSYMHYAPDWVQADHERFPRVRRADGSEVPYVSCYNSRNLLEKDTEAVSRIFEHLRDCDRERRVVLFQVNNETGILGGTDRCHCPVCNEFFGKGTYEASYGSRAGEVFSARSNLAYQEHIASAAKAIYPLPCYMNAWLALPYPDSIAGYTYPSGGPVYRVLGIYAQDKRAIDFVSPDIYTPGYRDFHRVCSQYKYNGNPLYVAEHALGRASRAYKNVYYAFGEFAALGFDPWAIDCAYPDIMEAPLCDMVHGRLSAEAYDMLESFVPIRDAMQPVAEHMGTPALKYWVQEESELEQALDFGDVLVKVKYCDPRHGQSRGMAVRLSQHEFVLLGCKSLITFYAPDGKKLEIKDSFRGRFEGKKFISERRNTIAWHDEAADLVWIKECGVCTAIIKGDKEC